MMVKRDMGLTLDSVTQHLRMKRMKEKSVKKMMLKKKKKNQRRDQQMKSSKCCFLRWIPLQVGVLWLFHRS